MSYHSIINEAENLIKSAEKFRNETSSLEIKEKLSEFIDGFTKLKNEFIKPEEKELFFGENIKDAISSLKSK
jgi:hypothetical protein